MFKKKLILSALAIAFCMQISMPAFAGQTVYTPANQIYVGGANGQTIIVRDSYPNQTIVVRETVPQTVVVQETETYYPQTAYVSNDSLLAAGITGLIGGVILGATLDNHHSKHKKHHAAPPSKPKHHFDARPSKQSPHHGGGKPSHGNNGKPHR